MSSGEEHATTDRKHPDFPDCWGHPLGDKWSELRADWVRSNVEMRTAVGRAARLRQLALQTRLLELRVKAARYR